MDVGWDRSVRAVRGVARDAGRLQYCEHGAESCRTRTAAYAYDRESRSFRGADAIARELVATTCRD